MTPFFLHSLFFSQKKDCFHRFIKNKNVTLHFDMLHEIKKNNQ